MFHHDTGFAVKFLQLLSKSSQSVWSDVLPAYGFGLRFEYKKDMNLRADLGFGRNAWGFSFGFSEAF